MGFIKEGDNYKKIFQWILINLTYDYSQTMALNFVAMVKKGVEQGMLNTVQDAVDQLKALHKNIVSVQVPIPSVNR